jgi:multidrug efflux pump subunit AcrB
VTYSPPTYRHRLNLSRLALAHPGITIGLWLLIGASGLLAAWRLPIALFPDIVFPVIVVTIDAPGKPAETIERELTGPVEQRLIGLRDRDAVTSTTTPGRAYITVPFNVGLNLDMADKRVKGALTGLEFPDPDRIRIQRVDMNETPIATYAITLRAGIPAPDRLADHVGRFASRLAAIPGVARVVPLGSELTGSREVLTGVRLNGEPAAALEVIKQANANTLEVARAVDRVVREAQSQGPVHVTAVHAEAPYVREATGATLEALWLAVMLSVLVIHPFLRNIAATAISGLAIPTSLAGTFLVMALAGFKFETITLLALALVIGIIVDDAIVDVENIVRHLPKSSDAVSGVRRATDEIGLTVTAATLTIVAVFVPVALMRGVVGTFFRPFGLTISAAVLSSLLVARTLTPVLAARWLEAGIKRVPPPSRLWQWTSERYRRTLGWSLRRPVAVLAVAVATLIGGILLIPLIPQGFIPTLDRGECTVHFSVARGSELPTTDVAAKLIDRLLGADPDVATVLSVAGSVDGDPASGLAYVTLRADRASSTQAVEARLRRVLAAQTLAHVSVENPPIIAVAAPQPLEITLTGNGEGHLALAAARVLERVRGWPGVADSAVAGAGPEGDGTWVHYDGRPAAVIRANLTGSVALGAVSDRVASELPRALPSGVGLVVGGESAQAADVLRHFSLALSLALCGVLVVLLALFRSWQDPVAIAMALPLCVVGAMLGLFLTRSDFGIVSLLGLVFLIGLVNKNAIILVDRINQLRAAGLGRREAILEAGPVRLRPIAMTTAAAVLGMLPIALGYGAGSELRAPMAVSIIGGLLTSSLLSLVVVPVIYQLLDDLRPRFR